MTDLFLRSNVQLKVHSFFREKLHKKNKRTNIDLPEILRHVIVSVLEMEDLENRVIEDLPVVSSVRFHTGDKTHKAGLYVNLRCCEASSYGGCGAKLVGSIHKSSERPTTVDCLCELGRVIQRDHGPTCITATQELQVAEKDDADVYDAGTRLAHE
jgi:hypothetical protein